MRELRAITAALGGAFERAGYGEVLTPALEYEEVLRTGDANAAGAGYRMFDEQGQVLALRSDMTIPIARLVATRFRGVEGPLRLSYSGHAYRAVAHGSGQQREFRQNGLELIGAEGAEAEAEVIALTLTALDEAGLARHRVGLGDGALYRTLLDGLDVPEERRGPLLDCLSQRDLVTLGRRARGPAPPRGAPASRGPAVTGSPAGVRGAPRARPGRRAGCGTARRRRGPRGGAPGRPRPAR